MSILIDRVYAELARFSSASRLYEVIIDGADGAHSLLVEAFFADDAVQGVGMRSIIALSTSAHLDFEAMLGRKASVAVSLADGTRTTFAGEIRDAATLCSNGGLARYHISIVSWLWRLSQVRNSRVWQDRSVVEIIDAVFEQYGTVAIWRWSDELPACLAAVPARSYCCQYRETDLDFVRRILNEEGLTWRIEQTDSGPGMVVFADSTQACAVPEDASSHADGGIRFHNARTGERQDTIQALNASRSIHATLATVLSYDYKAKRVVTAGAPSAFLGGRATHLIESYDAPGPYFFAIAAQARRCADLQMQMLEARGRLWQGRSTLRTLRAGTRVSVLDAPLQQLGEQNGLTILRVRSIGVNNLPLPAQEALAELFGPIPELLQEFTGDDPPQDFALVLEQARSSGYANAFDAIAADIPWRGELPGIAAPRPIKPTAHGSQSATVVGADGSDHFRGADEMYCDGLGRVRIRFHWDETGEATCWVRVAQRSAGGGMGTQFLPRIGMEVLVQFLENDIDRPIIVGALYNGQGEGGLAPTPGGEVGNRDQTCFARASDQAPSGQGNLAGGNSPVWHRASAESAGHRNGAAQWGIRTKEFGGVGYNQLLFDDTDAQGRIQLKCSHAATELNLGHLIHAADNYRGSFRGLGVELRTDSYGAVRAGAGLLISSYMIGHNVRARDPAGDNGPGIAMLKQAVTTAEAFHRAAVTHKTCPSAADDRVAPLNAMLTAISGMVSDTTLHAARCDVDAKNTKPTNGKLPHTTDSAIAIAAQAGLGLVAGQSMQLANGETVMLMSGQDMQFTTGRQMRWHTGQAMGVLGGAMAPGPDGIGLQLTAAKGAIDLQAQAGRMAVQARDDVNIVSVNAHIDWAAAKSISLSTAGGANITIEGGNITVQCPGKLTIHAGSKIFGGPERTTYALPHLPLASVTPTDLEFRYFTEWGEPLAGRAFRARLSDGTTRTGTLDQEGYARLVGVSQGSTAVIHYLPDTAAPVTFVHSELDDDLLAFFDFNMPLPGETT